MLATVHSVQHLELSKPIVSVIANERHTMKGSEVSDIAFIVRNLFRYATKKEVINVVAFTNSEIYSTRDTYLLAFSSHHWLNHFWRYVSHDF